MTRTKMSITLDGAKAARTMPKYDPTHPEHADKAKCEEETCLNVYLCSAPTALWRQEGFSLASRMACSTAAVFLARPVPVFLSVLCKSGKNPFLPVN